MPFILCFHTLSRSVSAYTRRKNIIIIWGHHIDLLMHMISKKVDCRGLSKRVSLCHLIQSFIRKRKENQIYYAIYVSLHVRMRYIILTSHTEWLIKCCILHWNNPLVMWVRHIEQLNPYIYNILWMYLLKWETCLVMNESCLHVGFSSHLRMTLAFINQPTNDRHGVQRQ